MFQKFLPLASLAAALSAFAGPVAAQSSVTLFGVVDGNLRVVKNGDVTIRQIGTDSVNSSRLGVRGVEDLGGGLRAGFHLEHGFQVDSGTQTSPSKFWNRRATLSLAGGFGELRLGRDYTPTFWNLALFDPFQALGIGSSMNPMAPGPRLDILGAGSFTAVRADNTVAYYLPGGLGGVYGQVTVAAGEGVAGNRYAGARLGWQAGPVDVALAVAQTSTEPDKLKMVNAGASYDFGVLKLMAIVDQVKAGAKQQIDWQIGTVALVGAGEIRAAYHRANASGAGTDANDATQVAFGYVHNLSRRTALYGTFARIGNRGVANYTVALPPPAVAGENSLAYELGMRHTF